MKRAVVCGRVGNFLPRNNFLGHDATVTVKPKGAGAQVGNLDPCARLKVLNLYIPILVCYLCDNNGKCLIFDRLVFGFNVFDSIIEVDVDKVANFKTCHVALVQ